MTPRFGKEPSCTLNHEVMRHELTEKGLPATPCPSCDWEIRPRIKEELEEVTMTITKREAQLLELEFSNYWINRDRYSETAPLIKKIFYFAETGKVDDD